MIIRAHVAAFLTGVRAGPPPMADVALRYGLGITPRSIVVDIVAPDGRLLGSATVPGGQRFVEVALVAPITDAAAARARVG